MAGFEPWRSCVVIDCFSNCVTAPVQVRRFHVRAKNSCIIDQLSSLGLVLYHLNRQGNQCQMMVSLLPFPSLESIKNVLVFLTFYIFNEIAKHHKVYKKPF